LLLLSLGYVGSCIAENWALVRRTQIQSPPWLIACVLCYAISHLSTGLAWPLAVRQLGTAISLRNGFRIGLVAQIGKYLPGNIAHYAGRGALATQVGVSLKSSGISTAIELASALSAVMLVAAIGLMVDPRPLAWLPAVSSPALAVMAVTIVALGAVCFWLIRRGARPEQLIGPTLCLAVSFLLSGISVYALARALGHEELPLAIAVGTFALAWGAGFVVIGAPAGLGVREATLLALLSPMVGASAAIVIAIVHRIVTAITDAAAALIGYGWMGWGAVSKK
jgi:uncharacterized membrane protein YbhN (UPF0104 family)